MRHAGNISLTRTQILAEAEGFTKLDLRDRLLPWLQRSNLAYVRRLQSGKIDTVESLVLTYEPLLVAVAEFYDSLEPTPEDQGCVQVLAMASALPRPHSEILHTVAQGIGEQPARRAIEPAKNYHVVAYRAGKGLPEPILYSERIWTKFSAKAAQSLSPLRADDRAVLLELVDKVQQYQGIPESLAREEARKHGAKHILEARRWNRSVEPHTDSEFMWDCDQLALLDRSGSDRVHTSTSAIC